MRPNWARRWAINAGETGRDVHGRDRAQAGKVAYVGPLAADQHDVLSARFGKITNLNKAYARLRMVKSAEELDWLRIGAHFSDLVRPLRVGIVNDDPERLHALLAYLG